VKVKHVVVAVAVFCLAGIARAEDLSFNSSFGPMEIHFGPGGELSGHYQQTGQPTGGPPRQGRLDGGVSAGGIVGGFWLPPGGDHACPRPRQQTSAWGHFEITNAWSANPHGVWGYCDEIPNRSWDLQRR
jgi:hypothetical protein